MGNLYVIDLNFNKNEHIHYFKAILLLLAKKQIVFAAEYKANKDMN